MTWVVMNFNTIYSVYLDNQSRAIITCEHHFYDFLRLPGRGTLPVWTFFFEFYDTPYSIRKSLTWINTIPVQIVIGNEKAK